MFSTEIKVALPRESLSMTLLERPFAVLLDSRDPEWKDNAFLIEKISELFRMGCRYYAVFGPDSEVIHDQIDDLLMKEAGDVELIPTTFHNEEAVEDVMAFFKIAAMSGMKQGLLLASNSSEWLANL